MWFVVLEPGRGKSKVLAFDEGFLTMSQLGRRRGEGSMETTEKMGAEPHPLIRNPLLRQWRKSAPIQSHSEMSQWQQNSTMSFGGDSQNISIQEVKSSERCDECNSSIYKEKGKKKNLVKWLGVLHVKGVENGRDPAILILVVLPPHSNMSTILVIDNINQWGWLPKCLGGRLWIDFLFWLNKYV